MTSGRISFWSLLALGFVLLAFACQEAPLEPDARARSPITPACTPGTQCDLEPADEEIPEEEILGGVFLDGMAISLAQAEGDTVFLTEVGGGACVYTADAPETCLGTSSMPVIPTGSVNSKRPDNHWGWFNDLGTDRNPCQAGNPENYEWHDLNKDGVPDTTSGPERHCAKRGVYDVVLKRGDVLSTSAASSTPEQLRARSRGVRLKI